MGLVPDQTIHLRCIRHVPAKGFQSRALRLNPSLLFLILNKPSFLVFQRREKFVYAFGSRGQPAEFTKLPQRTSESGMCLHTMYVVFLVHEIHISSENREEA